MIGRVIHYHALRRNRLSHGMAWKMSGLWLYANKARQWAGVAIVAGCCLYLMSSAANSAQESADNRVATKVSQQANEIDALRKIVAACLGDKEGALMIGGETFLCRAISIGRHK